MVLIFVQAISISYAIKKRCLNINYRRRDESSFGRKTAFNKKNHKNFVGKYSFDGQYKFL